MNEAISRISKMFVSHFSSVPEVEFRRYGFSEYDIVGFKDILNSSKDKGSIQEAVQFLDEVYCNHIAAEFLYLEVCITLIFLYQFTTNSLELLCFSQRTDYHDSISKSSFSSFCRTKKKLSGFQKN